MQFCPRCGAQNQDGRAACWKCFGILQKPDSKKAQRIVMTGNDAPAADVHATPDAALDATPAAAPILELAEPEPEPEPAAPVVEPAAEEPAAPAFAVDTPPAIEPEPEAFAPTAVEAPAPEPASLGDVMIPSPSFGSSDDKAEEEASAQPVPILGLVNLDDEPAVPDTDETETEPAIGFGGLSDEPLVVESADDAQAAAGTDEAALPWWMTQDDTEDTSSGTTTDNPTIDLDDDGLKFISLDDDDDSDSQKSPPGA